MPVLSAAEGHEAAGQGPSWAKRRDLDFGQRQSRVRDTKGGKDRVTILPNCLIKLLRVQLVTAKQLHEQDLADGYEAVYLPYVLKRSGAHRLLLDSKEAVHRLDITKIRHFGQAVVVKTLETHRPCQQR